MAGLLTQAFHKAAPSRFTQWLLQLQQHLQRRVRSRFSLDSLFSPKIFGSTIKFYFNLIRLYQKCKFMSIAKYSLQRFRTKRTEFKFGKSILILKTLIDNIKECKFCTLLILATSVYHSFEVLGFAVTRNGTGRADYVSFGSYIAYLFFCEGINFFRSSE